MRGSSALPLFGMTLLTSFYGCHHPRGDYALAAAEVVPHQYTTVLGHRTSGEYCTSPTSLALDRDDAVEMYREAARRALAQAPGANALIEVEITLSSRFCARIEGQPVTLR